VVEQLQHEHAPEHGQEACQRLPEENRSPAEPFTEEKTTSPPLERNSCCPDPTCSPHCFSPCSSRPPGQTPPSRPAAPSATSPPRWARRRRAGTARPTTGRCTTPARCAWPSSTTARSG